MNIKINEIFVYKTTDGKLFENYDDAVDYKDNANNKINTINNYIKNILDNNLFDINKYRLEIFIGLFHKYFDYLNTIPFIFPTIDGNIQLELQRDDKNINCIVNLIELNCNIFYYDNNIEKEEIVQLNNEKGWLVLNNFFNLFI